MDKNNEWTVVSSKKLKETKSGSAELEDGQATRFSLLENKKKSISFSNASVFPYKLLNIDISINNNNNSSSEILSKLNKLAGKHGIGRLDLVENRYTGMKSRGCYETPGGTILLRAHRAIESITLDAEAGHLKDGLMPKYAQLIYDGYWWSPEREALQALIDKTQEFVSGSVKMSLYKGNITILGRSSDLSLYDSKIVTFEDDENTYNQEDATGFIKINSLRLKQVARRKKKAEG